MSGLVGHYGGVDHSLGVWCDAHGAVFYLFKQVGFTAGVAELEMFHVACGPFVISCHCSCYVEYVDSPLPEVMERFAAFRIRAVVHHGGPRRNHGQPCSASGLLESIALHARENSAPNSSKHRDT